MKYVIVPVCVIAISILFTSAAYSRDMTRPQTLQWLGSLQKSYMTSYIFDNDIKILAKQVADYKYLIIAKLADDDDGVRLRFLSDVSEPAELLDVTTDHRLKWTLDIETGQIVLELMRD